MFNFENINENKPQNQKYFLYFRIFLYILLFVGVIFGFKSYVKSVYDKELQKNQSEITKNKTEFSENLKKSNKSAIYLTALGKKMLDEKNTEYAAIILEIAAEKDPYYRDSTLLAGYANILLNRNEKAVQMLEKASTIDPLYPRTFELLSIGYKNLKDDKNFDICYNKFKQLSLVKKEL